MDNLILDPYCKELYDKTFSHKDYPIKPAFMNNTHKINDCDVTIGVGGVHGFYKPGVYHNLYEYDVVSFYPSIILQCELGTDRFRAVYKELYDMRMNIKESDPVGSNSLKLALNSLYGKLSDKYSHRQIYAPHIRLNICLLGQFYLLDLIDKLKDNQLIMLNTDGIFVKNKIPDDVIYEWEKRTGFKLSVNKYPYIIYKDCNSYYGLREDGKEKRKKEFLTPTWTHNVRFPIIQKVLLDNIINNQNIYDALQEEKDIYNFLAFDKVKKGNTLIYGEDILKDNKIRYYVSKKGKPLFRKTDKKLSRAVGTNKSPLNTTLCMNLKEGNIDNVNLEFYYDKVIKLKKAILGV